MYDLNTTVTKKKRGTETHLLKSAAALAKAMMGKQQDLDNSTEKHARKKRA